jgi:hypothetical protein
MSKRDCKWPGGTLLIQVASQPRAVKKSRPSRALLHTLIHFALALTVLQNNKELHAIGTIAVFLRPKEPLLVPPQKVRYIKVIPYATLLFA